MNWRGILGRATRAAPVADEELDAIVANRLSAIAGRTTGRRPALSTVPEVVELTEPEIEAEAEAEAQAVPEAEVADAPLAEGADEAAEPVVEVVTEPETDAVAAPDAEPVAEATGETDADGPEEAGLAEHVPGAVACDEVALEPIVETGPDDVAELTPNADPVESAPDEETAVVEEIAAAVDIDAANSDDFAVPTAADAVEDTPASPEPVAVEARAAAPSSLETLPGFPWTARYIALWSREVSTICPPDLRDAVLHWQRWADTQPAGAPLPEEAMLEFNAMLAYWREGGAEVPGTAIEDFTAQQIAAESQGNAALADLLPGVLNGA